MKKAIIKEPILGQWYLGECLYAGTHTQVYTLTRIDLNTERPCVLKLTRVPAQDEAELCRAKEECRTQIRMAGCGYAVAILDDSVMPVIDDDGNTLAYDVMLRMEQLECLSDLMREGSRFSEADVLTLARHICMALRYAHRRGILHRDIKPGNIYRSDSGDYKLGDFGAAAEIRAEKVGTVVGTEAYMAPEVASGQNYGAAADLYCLGVVLYQLLNHNFLPMTDENSAYSDIQNAISARLKGVRLPRVACKLKFLQRAVMRACEPDPKKRFQSAQDMLTALEEPHYQGLRVAAAVCASAVFLVLGFGIGRLTGRTIYSTQEQERPAAVTEITDDSGETAVVHRYEVVSQKMTWEDARIWCESRGGHLATITSAEESSKIISLLEDAGLQVAWLGANNRNTANGFQWVTGEPFAYAEWGTGEPNNTDGVEYYLMLVKKDDQGWVWNDSRLEGMDVFTAADVGFVCEWEGGNP